MLKKWSCTTNIAPELSGSLPTPDGGFDFVAKYGVLKDPKPFPSPHQENKLSTFDKDMKAFTRALDQAVLPKPKLLEVRTSILCDCVFHDLLSP